MVAKGGVGFWVVDWKGLSSWREGERVETVWLHVLLDIILPTN